MFEKASIPTVSEYRIVQLTEYRDRYYNLKKSYNRDRNKTSFDQTFDDIKHKSALLFDVAACQCYAIIVDCSSKKNTNLCQCLISVNCKCEKSKKIPVIELRFLHLHRKYGIGKIGAIDLQETQKLTKNLTGRPKFQTMCGISKPHINREPSCRAFCQLLRFL